MSEEFIIAFAIVSVIELIYLIFCFVYIKSMERELKIIRDELDDMKYCIKKEV